MSPYPAVPAPRGPQCIGDRNFDRLDTTGVIQLGENPTIDLRQPAAIQGHQRTFPVNQLTERNLLQLRV